MRSSVVTARLVQAPEQQGSLGADTAFSRAPLGGQGGWSRKKALLSSVLFKEVVWASFNPGKKLKHCFKNVFELNL